MRVGGDVCVCVCVRGGSRQHQVASQLEPMVNPSSAHYPVEVEESTRLPLNMHTA